MSYKSLDIQNLYTKSLDTNDDLLLTGIYFLMLTIEGYDSIAMKELDKITGTDNFGIKLKIKSTLSNKNWLNVFNHLASYIENEGGRNFLISLQKEFKSTFESSPYLQSRFSGRRATMFKKSTLENMNLIH
jgi:hypothetical protein